MTNQQEQSAWLATELMGYQQVQREDDKGPWWEKAGGEPVAPVDHWDPDYPVWAPHEIIAQAKEVQAAMRARGWMLSIDDGKDGFYFIQFRQYQEGAGRSYGGMVAGVAGSKSEADGICLAAGRALGWPFEEEAC